MTRFVRTENLIGKSAVEKLSKMHVAVFGLGGVGGYVAEALARAGVGQLTLVDFDVIAQSNLNRQIYALCSTVGQLKTDAAKRRIADINPDCVVNSLPIRFDADTLHNFDFASFNYVADAIDTVTSKLLIAQACKEANTPVISCMGTGNKLNATLFEVADISQTSVCPLAKVMRRELKRRGIERLKVVYSKEQPLTPQNPEVTSKRQTPASISFVPPVAGLIMAGEIVKDLIRQLI